MSTSIRPINFSPCMVFFSCPQKVVAKRFTLLNDLLGATPYVDEKPKCWHQDWVYNYCPTCKL
jgi:hypothetical protein